MKQRLAQKWRPDFWFFVRVAVIVSMCLFIVYPFYNIITKSIFSDKVEGVTLYNFIRFFSKPYYYEPLIRSIVVCTTTVLTSTLIGVPIAYVLTRYNIPCKKLVVRTEILRQHLCIHHQEHHNYLQLPKGYIFLLIPLFCLNHNCSQEYVLRK